MNSILFLFVILTNGQAHAFVQSEHETHKACLVAMKAAEETVKVPADTKEAVLMCVHHNVV